MSMPLRFESFRQEWKGKEAKSHHSSSLVPTVRHSGGAVTSEGQVSLRTGLLVLHQAQVKSRGMIGDRMSGGILGC